MVSYSQALAPVRGPSTHILNIAIEHVDHPWKIVPASLIVFQLRRMLGMRSASTPIASRIGIPINKFDAMRVVLRKAP